MAVHVRAAVDRQWVRQHYNVQTNIPDGDLSEAQVICIGEAYGNDGQERNSAQIINDLYQDRDTDVLLVEADSGRQDIPLDGGRFVHIQKQIQVRGWDTNNQVVHDVVHAMVAAENPEREFRLKRVGAQAELLAQRNNAEEEIPVREACCFLLTAYFWKKVVEYCSCCIACSAQMKYKRTFQQYLDLFPERNASMVQVVESALQMHQRVFVIGASSHFCETREREFDVSKQHQAIGATVDALSRYRYAILIPK